MPATSLSLPVPPGFAFWPTVRSHGWFDLPPFRADPPGRSLEVVMALDSGQVLRARLAEARGRIAVRLEARAPLPRAAIGVVRDRLRSVLRLDQDLEPFYRLADADPRLSWVRAMGAGRLLRAPSAWEDLVKLLLTTNCSWALTRAMTANLIQALGPDDERTGRAFPPARIMAGHGERFYREVVRAGYRAPFLAAAAERVAAGRLDPERWRDPSLPLELLERQIGSVAGAGPYVVGNLLKLVGRYPRLALDSWARAKWRRLRGKRRAADATIERAYRGYGEWRGLALWMELTADWFANEVWAPK